MFLDKLKWRVGLESSNMQLVFFKFTSLEASSFRIPVVIAAPARWFYRSVCGSRVNRWVDIIHIIHIAVRHVRSLCRDVANLVTCYLSPTIKEATWGQRAPIERDWKLWGALVNPKFLAGTCTRLSAILPASHGGEVYPSRSRIYGWLLGRATHEKLKATYDLSLSASGVC